MSNPFEQMQNFVAVVEHKSFTAAADGLQSTKSAVSRKVSELEQRLGVQLLNRTTRRLSLTQQGEQYYQRAVHVLQEWQSAEEDLQRQQGDLKGRIKLSAPLSFGVQHLPDTLAAFHAQHPNIEVQLDLNDRTVDLIEEGFDLALRVGDLADSSYQARALAKIRFVTCASPAYLKQHGEPQSPKQLSQHQGLFYTLVNPNRVWQFELNGQTKTFMPQRRFSANNGDFLAQLAVRGLGISRQPTFIVSELIQAGQLQAILCAYSTPSTQIHAVYPPGRLISQRVRTLVEFLAGEWGEWPVWDTGLNLDWQGEKRNGPGLQA